MKHAVIFNQKQTQKTEINNKQTKLKEETTMKVKTEQMSNDQLAELLINYGTAEIIVTKSTKTCEVFFNEDYIEYEEDDLPCAYEHAAIVAMYIYNSQRIKFLREQQQLQINKFVFYNRTKEKPKYFEFYKAGIEEVSRYWANGEHWAITFPIEIKD